MSLSAKLSRLAAAPAKALFPLACALSLSLSVAGCGAVVDGPPPRHPDTTKWIERANKHFQIANLEEAKDSINKALCLAPNDADVKLLAAKIHLAMLDYAE